MPIILGLDRLTQPVLRIPAVVTTSVIEAITATAELEDAVDTGLLTMNLTFTNINSSTYTVLATDDILGVSYTITGSVIITIPSALIAVVAKAIRIIDTGGNAGINNITINTEGSETINGDANFVINSDDGSILLISDGSNLFIG